MVQPPLPVCSFPAGFPGTPAPFPVIPAAPSAAPVPAVELVVYTNADWAGCPDTRRSTSGYTVFLGGNLVS
jgi:hypothetical protein